MRPILAIIFPSAAEWLDRYQDKPARGALYIYVGSETTMDISEAIRGRRAVREFMTQPMDDSTLRELVDAAIQAPSAINQQPWLFTIIRNKELLARISTEAKSYMLQRSSTALASHHFLNILNDETFDIFYGAPTLIVISAPKGPWAVEDCSLAAENLMLAAHAAGMGTCWIGFAQGWLGTRNGNSAIKLPDGYAPVAPIIVGHPKSAPPAVLRKTPRIDWIS